MAVDLGDTWDVIHVVLFLETMYVPFVDAPCLIHHHNSLYGMALLQTWLYFLWYPKDSWKLKLIVSSMSIPISAFQSETQVLTLAWVHLLLNCRHL